MEFLPFAVQSVMVSFAPLFSKCVFDHVRLLMVGAILAPGKRTVSAVLRIMGKDQAPEFQAYHRVLNRACWSALQGSRILLLQLVEAFVPSGPVLLGVDETIERRWGAKIAARGIYRDPVRSSKSHVVKARGLRWVCLMLLVPVPWAHRGWALPFLTVLSPSERSYQRCGRAGQTLLDRARQAICLVRRWMPDRELRIVADNSYSALEWLATVSQGATVITRLRLDAALYEPAAPRKPGQRGRPRKKGKRLPT
jgi:DDE superfamily endonuclease